MFVRAQMMVENVLGSLWGGFVCVGRGSKFGSNLSFEISSRNKNFGANKTQD